MSEEKVFSEPTFALVELLGRQQIVGRVTEVAIAGTNMLRVDIPKHDDQEAYTRFVGGGAIYAITPLSEESAMFAISSLSSPPIDLWCFPQYRIFSPDEDYDEDGPKF